MQYHATPFNIYNTYLWLTSDCRNDMCDWKAKELDFFKWPNHIRECQSGVLYASACELSCHLNKQKNPSLCVDDWAATLYLLTNVFEDNINSKNNAATLYIFSSVEIQLIMDQESFFPYPKTLSQTFILFIIPYILYITTIKLSTMF